MRLSVKARTVLLKTEGDALKRIIIKALAALLLIAAVGLTVYPPVSNYVNDKYQSLVRTEYVEEVEKSDAAKLTEAQVKMMRELYANGHSQKEIADAFSISRRHVNDIVNGRTWKLEG